MLRGVEDDARGQNADEAVHLGTLPNLIHKLSRNNFSDHAAILPVWMEREVGK
jgi:hypothetical protein